LRRIFRAREIGHHIRSDKFIRDVDEGEISGSDVFLVFFCLDEVLVTADSIVRSLEEYVEEMSGRSGRKSNHYALAAGGRIREQLQAQSIQLRRLRNLLRKNLDSSSDIWHKSPLSQMVDRKGSRISRILHAISLEGGVSLPLDKKPSANKQKLTTTEIPTDVSWPRVMLPADEWELTTVKIRTNVNWDRKIFALVQQYLDEYQPRRELDSLREAATELRELIRERFSIDDVLISVADDRLSTPRY
jgi:hypothetical protein